MLNRWTNVFPTSPCIGVNNHESLSHEIHTDIAHNNIGTDYKDTTHTMVKHRWIS